MCDGDFFFCANYLLCVASYYPKYMTVVCSVLTQAQIQKLISQNVILRIVQNTED